MDSRRRPLVRKGVARSRLLELLKRINPMFDRHGKRTGDCHLAGSMRNMGCDVCLMVRNPSYCGDLKSNVITY